MKRLCHLLIILSLLFSFQTARPQDTDSVSLTLPSVVVKAYEGTRKLKEIPAGVNYISSYQLRRTDNISIVSAVNTTPGVKMEERSPGSYRLNIRGSSLRSPFGVRNVKVYWNQIPFTDPGGNTYLNQLSPDVIKSIEIIKGPSGSLYGAGIGGVVLINNGDENLSNGLDLGITGGSYNLGGANAQFKTGTEKFSNTFNAGRLYKNGYRYHTEMRRNIGTWKLQARTSAKNKLEFNFLFGDLYYQTPGGLTRTEYEANRKSSRPAAGAFPSAETAKAAIYQKMLLGGVTNTYQFSEDLSNVTTVYGAYSEIKNPTFRNYETRYEPHFGGRTLFKWRPASFKNTTTFILGSEFQKGNFNTKTFTNSNGSKGTLQTNDDVDNSNLLLFAQADLSLDHDLNITAGASISRFHVGITRLNVTNPQEQSRTYKNEVSPRIAISKRLFKDLWGYVSIARGFSPPTVAEVLPSTSVISTNLNAEHGLNYEAGIKALWLNDRLYTEINAFYYRLKDAIVQRRDASNADYFINAGSTRQKGIETQAQYTAVKNATSVINNLSFKIAYTLYNFSYSDFKQVTNDFTGKKLPGVPRNTIAGLMDLSIKNGVYLNLTYYFGDRVALNDANSVYADSYNLLGLKAGWRKPGAGKIGLDLFAGADNLFNVDYSLGNDVNAAGGRYYNPAAGINFYAGARLHIATKKQKR